MIKYCTRFTDDIFNALLSLTFLREGSNSIVRSFRNDVENYDVSKPFVSLAVALGTVWGMETSGDFKEVSNFCMLVRH